MRNARLNAFPLYESRLRKPFIGAARIMKEKLHAEINGKYWEAAIPFCCGCPEYVINGFCGYEGNGCRYPEQRIKNPISFRNAFFKMATMSGKGIEKLSEELGDCLNPLEKERAASAESQPAIIQQAAIQNGEGK
jgi:hypothetical protein